MRLPRRFLLIYRFGPSFSLPPFLNPVDQKQPKCRVSRLSLTGQHPEAQDITHFSSQVNACEMPHVVRQKNLQTSLVQPFLTTIPIRVGGRPKNLINYDKPDGKRARLFSIAIFYVAIAVPDDSNPPASLLTLASASARNPGRYLDRYLPAIGLASSTNWPC